jgi:hypothetical protein
MDPGTRLALVTLLMFAAVALAYQFMRASRNRTAFAAVTLTPLFRLDLTALLSPFSLLFTGTDPRRVSAGKHPLNLFNSVLAETNGNTCLLDRMLANSSRARPGRLVYTDVGGPGLGHSTMRGFLPFATTRNRCADGNSTTNDEGDHDRPNAT